MLSAVAIPVFLLLTALVVDAGNWFTHKRQLQNKADAGALAAGVEYISQLNNCVTAPGVTGSAITDVAKNFAGTTEAIPGTKYNTTINQPSQLTVRINATSATAADWTDGGSPCADHATGDSISAGGYWTDVKARETNIGTLFGGFGLNLPSVEAQARVEVKQLLGVRHGGLPLVNESGDYVDCVWAQFVNVRTGATSGILAGGVSNPIALTLDSTTPRHWTGKRAGRHRHHVERGRHRCAVLDGRQHRRNLQLLDDAQGNRAGRPDQLDQRLRRRHAGWQPGAAPPPLHADARVLWPEPRRIHQLDGLVHGLLQRGGRQGARRQHLSHEDHRRHRECDDTDRRDRHGCEPEPPERAGDG